ncbi:ABC transporter ATP-binding protein [Kineococcus indalonis]|uniref:ABC transporter ATP-binding protein n=1 Tax=Kineococcus indalonis TaxID=2696566 RepID=UPI0014135C9F|nr:ABC transporter ATP-binding protein [Kineococcus indalonis]NAZ84747.1 ATP-binding cassette domain-containing protein [Kineococcus indalonis]
MPIVEVQHLTKRYGGRPVVDGVSFTVEEGEVLGLLGHNGAGKTTTVECVAGLRAPDAGTVRVLGVDPAARRDVARRAVGVQLQESTLPDRLRVGEALRLFASFHPAPVDVAALLEALGLAEHRAQAYGDLSGGLKQRLSFALALVGAPRVAVLDELTTGLDPRARREVWQQVRAVVRTRGVAVLLVTHSMEEAERLCDRAAVLARGRVVALDTPAGLVERVAGEQSVRFTPSAALDPAVLRALPEVTDVTTDAPDGLVQVHGRGELVHAVVSVLAREGVVARGLRIERTTLDDAYLALTGSWWTAEQGVTEHEGVHREEVRR